MGGGISIGPSAPKRRLRQEEGQLGNFFGFDERQLANYIGQSPILSGANADALNQESSIRSWVDPVLASGGALTSDQRRQVNQDTAAAFASRGNVAGNQEIVSDVMNLQNAKDARYARALAESSGGINQLLTTQGANVGTFAALTDPLLSYASNLFGGNQAAQLSQQFANQNKGAGTIGGSISAVGDIIGGIVRSDKRLKEKIRDTGETTPDAIPIKTFQYKGDPSKSRFIGVLAQDVEKKRPDAVLHDRSGIKRVNISALDAPFFRLPPKRKGFQHGGRAGGHGGGGGGWGANDVPPGWTYMGGGWISDANGNWLGPGGQAFGPGQGSGGFPGGIDIPPAQGANEDSFGFEGFGPYGSNLDGGFGQNWGGGNYSFGQEVIIPTDQGGETLFAGDASTGGHPTIEQAGRGERAAGFGFNPFYGITGSGNDLGGYGAGYGGQGPGGGYFNMGGFGGGSIGVGDIGFGGSLGSVFGALGGGGGGVGNLWVHELARGGVVPKGRVPPPMIGGPPPPSYQRGNIGSRQRPGASPRPNASMASAFQFLINRLGFNPFLSSGPSMATGAPLMSTGTPMPSSLSRGGVVPNIRMLKGRGSDTVPGEVMGMPNTALTPGEIVFTDEQIKALMPRPGMKHKLRKDQLKALGA